MRPSSDRSRPAIAASVVDLPHPLGPSSVRNSPSPTVNEILSTARIAPNILTSPSTRNSAIDPHSQQAACDIDEQEGQPNLDRRQGGDGAVVAVLPELQYGGADHLAARREQEHRGDILLEAQDEDQRETGEQCRTDQRDQDR